MSQATGVTPAGFFDDVVKDAKARKIDLKHLQKKEAEKDWKEFQSFVETVQEEEKQETAALEVEVEEDTARDALEQMSYVDRYRKMLEKSVDLEKGKLAVVEESKDSQDDSSSVAAPEVDSTAAPSHVSELTQLLIKRKKKRKAAAAALKDNANTVVDPLNWRSKQR